MPVVATISHRMVLNSHVEFTPEFVVGFADGSSGHAASPQGETISIYEDRRVDIDPRGIIRTIEADGVLGRETDQVSFDGYLQERIPAIGRNNAFALSLAFFMAVRGGRPGLGLSGGPGPRPVPPRLSLNILNGGWHAYTNPVASEFSEFMLVARSRNVADVIPEHNAMQRLVRERQLWQAKTVVAGHLVSAFAGHDNRAPIEFLLDILEELGLSGKYELMIDASAGDLWKGGAYHFEITDRTARSSEEMVAYWSGLIREYGLRFLEDPFHEKDFAAWRALTAAEPACVVIGDNLYSSDETRIREGAANGYARGAVIKPNQAGTVTAAIRALETASATGQLTITSHRSISTESTFLSVLTCALGAEIVKIGPLATDFTSVARLNEIVRLTEPAHAG